MSGGETRGFIPDPEFDEWDGTYIGVKNAPPLTHYLQKILQYMKNNGKQFDELTKAEIEMFRIPGR